MFTADYVLNGSGHGPVGEMIAGCRFEPGLLRPYIETRWNSPLRGKPCVTMNTGRLTPDGKPIFNKYPIRALQERGINSPVFNATSLRKEEWLQAANW